MLTVFPHIYEGLQYTLDDFVATSTGCRVQFGFGVGPGVPESVKDIPSYIRWAKSSPQANAFASPAPGSLPHVLGLLLAEQSGVTLNHIPYRGSMPAVQDLLGGQVPAFCGLLGDWLPHLKSGRLRLLATSGQERSRMTPTVATFAEQGYKDMVMSEYYGFVLAKGATREVVRSVAAQVRDAVARQETIESFESIGLEAQSSTPEEMAALMRSELALWGKTIKRLNLKIET